MHNDLAAGALVGHYRVERLIAHGGLASTYEVLDSRNGARFALKRLAIGAVRDWKTVQLFEREARVLSGLRHPCIPRYVEHFEMELPAGEHAFYLVQELAPGASLAARRATGWRCDEAEVQRILRQLLGILRDLQGLMPPVFHRDVKPHNILLSDDGRVFLVDFGAVRDVHRTVTGGSTVVGTYGYMAPEQLRGVAVPATDVYGAATTALFLLTGSDPSELPQRGLRPDFRARVKCSATLAAWLDRALEPEPEKRFADARAALAALRQLPQSEKKRLRLGLGILAGALVVTGAAATLVTWSAQRGATRVVPPSLPHPVATRGALPPRPPSDRYAFNAAARVEVDAHGGGAFAIDVSPDSRTLASGGANGSIRLSDARTGEAIATFSDARGRVYSVHFTSDGQHLVTAAGSRVAVWNVPSGKAATGFEVDAREAVASRPSPDDRWIATAGSSDRALKLWDLATGKSVRTFEPSPSGISLAVAFTPDGKTIAAAGEDPTIRMWSTETGKLLATCTGHASTVNDLAYSPDGQTLYSVSDDHTLRVWGTDCKSHAILGDHSDEVWTVAANARGDLLATGTRDGWIKVWDPAKLILRYQFQDNAQGTTRLAFMPDGTGLAASQTVGRINVWQLGTTARHDVPASTSVRDLPESGPSPRVKEACVRANALIDSANGRDLLGEAEELARGALSKSPEYAPALCALARIALRRGYTTGDDYSKASVDEASGLLVRAAASAPAGLIDLRVARAWLLNAKLDFTGALREATGGSSTSPSSALDTIAAVVADKSPDTPISLTEHYARRALSEHPTRGEAWFAYAALGHALVKLGRYEDAGDAYRAQVQVDPDSAWAKGNFAHFLLRIGNYGAAQQLARQALAQLDYSYARATLSEAHSEEGILLLWDFQRPEDARKEFEEALRISPANSSAHYGLGAVWQLEANRTGDPSAAARAESELAKGRPQASK